jgi:hypothetical protein
MWRSATTIPVPPQTGPIPVELRWEETAGTQGGNACSTAGGNKCTGTFGTVQRTFSATEGRSGPIRHAQLWENGSFWANSFEIGTTRNLVVRLGIAPGLERAASVNDPPVAIRVTGSQNQSVDCDKDYPNLATEIANGCRPEYAVNQGTACPATATELYSMPQPWDCVPVQTGGAVGQVERGMQDRILGGSNTCTNPSNWSNFPNFDAADPRIVPVFLTPFGTFQGSGNEVIPVSGFATFYVTGWFGSPCATDDPVAERGHIVGRFIKHIDTINRGGAGQDLCDLGGLSACIAVLTD